jgi:guanylate kinase
VGKGTVVRRLLELRPEAALSISCTTRDPRPGEADGLDYRFISPDMFQELIDKDAFLEWAEVFGHRYGTLTEPIAEEVARGRNVILEIDVQGAAAVRQRMPEAVLIFLAPPSDGELERRLRARRTESEAELQRRLAAARREMDQRSWFDHVVVNDEVDRAAAELASIIDSASGGQQT